MSIIFSFFNGKLHAFYVKINKVILFMVKKMAIADINKMSI